MDKYYHPFAAKWEAEDSLPDSYWHSFISNNMFVPAMAMPLPCDWLKRVGIHDVLGIPVEDFDTLHGIIYSDEVYRSGVPGPYSVVGGFSKSISRMIIHILIYHSDCYPVFH